MAFADESSLLDGIAWAKLGGMCMLLPPLPQAMPAGPMNLHRGLWRPQASPPAAMLPPHSFCSGLADLLANPQMHQSFSCLKDFVLPGLSFWNVPHPDNSWVHTLILLKSAQMSPSSEAVCSSYAIKSILSSIPFHGFIPLLSSHPHLAWVKADPWPDSFPAVSSAFKNSAWFMTCSVNSCWMTMLMNEMVQAHHSR